MELTDKKTYMFQVDISYGNNILTFVDVKAENAEEAQMLVFKKINFKTTKTDNNK